MISLSLPCITNNRKSPSLLLVAQSPCNTIRPVTLLLKGDDKVGWIRSFLVGWCGIEWRRSSQIWFLIPLQNCAEIGNVSSRHGCRNLQPWWPQMMTILGDLDGIQNDIINRHDPNFHFLSKHLTHNSLIRRQCPLSPPWRTAIGTLEKTGSTRWLIVLT